MPTSTSESLFTFNHACIFSDLSKYVSTTMEIGTLFDKQTSWIQEGFFNFLRLPPTGDTTKCRIPKNGKIWGLPPEGDRINRSKRIFSRKRRPRVCYSTPNLALIGKGVWVHQSPNVKNMPNIVVFGHRKPPQ